MNRTRKNKSKNGKIFFENNFVTKDKKIPESPVNRITPRNREPRHLHSAEHAAQGGGDPRPSFGRTSPP